jgi:hypothetical protein
MQIEQITGVSTDAEIEQKKRNCNALDCLGSRYFCAVVSLIKKHRLLAPYTIVQYCGFYVRLYSIYCSVFILS